MERSLSLRGSSIPVARLLTWPGLVLLAAASGMIVATRTDWAWLCIGVWAGVVLINQPAFMWAGGALAVTVLSRALVSWGAAPAALNFAHFPLTMAAAFVAALERSEPSPLARRTGAGIVALLGVAFASWAFNGGELLRPILTWLVFVEPFLLFYAIVRSPMTAAQGRGFLALLLGLAALQIPFAIPQALQYGMGDAVAGTFRGLASGAHMAGAVACLGLLIVLMRTVQPGTSDRGRWVAATLALFIVPVLADAKQVIVAFLPPFALLAARGSGRRIGPAIAAVALLGALLVSAAYFYPPLSTVLDMKLFRGGIESKVSSAQIVVKRMQSSPIQLVLGLGPGNSISRVSLLTAGGLVSRDSPVAALGLQTAPATRALLDSFRSNYMWSSSAWTGISSWLGVFGDLGLLGLLIYVWLGYQIWTAAYECSAPLRAVISGGLLSAVALGVVYSWLEEPGYMLPLAVLCAAAWTAGKAEPDSNRAAEQAEIPAAPVPAGYATRRAGRWGKV